ncbi:hypothetical protein U0035_12755 [Niabella yanshanensis]|uniref:Uncharacterized protein n=1 Tax=Niabella yanshanensis TaxID=577386 RepID=A0ABZ0W226_9BACT|nr:hypothetical protein [Niabella yanshanensis]WQD36537.1 hypothetical protein U0035_12755 [Niabella yanshanensis]
MRRLITVFAILVTGLSLAGQPVTPGSKLKTVPGNYIYFSVDNLDNIYLLGASNQLKKLNANGDSVSVFNDIKKFGEASLVDVSNPVKILLYYKGFSTIAILDGMLNLKNTIDLRRQNIFNATAVGLSYDGKVWMYDDMDNVLKKLDDEGKVIFKTADFRQVFDKALAPVKVFDQNRLVYLYDSLQGIFVFDYYGAYKNKIDITHWNHLRVADQLITGVANGKLYRYNVSSLKYDEWPIPETMLNYRQLLLKEGKLYALGKEGLEIYKLSMP